MSSTRNVQVVKDSMDSRMIRSFAFATHLECLLLVEARTVAEILNASMISPTHS
jgi:hypothetical protein